jgi:hypothetical protein
VASTPNAGKGTTLTPLRQFANNSHKVMPILQKIVEGAKKELADAVANGGGLYAVGYWYVFYVMSRQVLHLF